MAQKITIEINKEAFFKNWEDEQVQNLSEEQKDEIIRFFVNRSLCLKRDKQMCKNENCKSEFNDIQDIHERKKYMSVHHIIPRRDFKENPQSMQKRLGYECNDLGNLITLCKPCHKGYERAQITLKINGQEYKLEKPQRTDIKAILKENKLMRKALTKLQKGWGNLTEDERLALICILMKWLTVDMVHELSD